MANLLTDVAQESMKMLKSWNITLTYDERGERRSFRGEALTTNTRSHTA
ncbi:hypothetical protein [Nitrospira sp. Nam74]